MTTVTYSIPTLHCGHCIHSVEMEVGELEVVQAIKAELATKKVQVTFDTPASEEKNKDTACRD